jgi:hypothetical protein
MPSTAESFKNEGNKGLSAGEAPAAARVIRMAPLLPLASLPTTELETEGTTLSDGGRNAMLPGTLVLTSVVTGKVTFMLPAIGIICALKTFSTL